MQYSKHSKFVHICELKLTKMYIHFKDFAIEAQFGDDA